MSVFIIFVNLTSQVLQSYTLSATYLHLHVPEEHTETEQIQKQSSSLQILHWKWNRKTNNTEVNDTGAGSSKEFFTNSLQYKNVNIANFVLAVPLEMSQAYEICNLEM